MDLKCNEKDQIKMNLGAIEKKDDGKAKQNQVVIKEMNENDRTNLCCLIHKILETLMGFDSWAIQLIPRVHNRETHNMAKKEISGNKSIMFF